MMDRACDHDRRAYLEAVLAGTAPDAVHCADCTGAREDIRRLVAAGRALSRSLPSDEAIDAAKLRFLDRLSRGRSGGSTTLLALAGGLLLISLFAAADAGRGAAASGARIAAGAEVVAAVDRPGVDADPGAPARHPAGPDRPRFASVRPLATPRTGLTRRQGRDIMAACEPICC